MISPLVLWPSFQSPALSRTEIQLPHRRCQRISREGRDGETNATGDKSSGYENLCNVPQRPMMVLVSAQGEEDGRDLPPWALSTATCTSHSGANLPGRNSRTSALASSKVWLPICQHRAFLPPPRAALPDASEKTPAWLHVPTAIIWCAKVSGPCLSMAGQSSSAGSYREEAGQKWRQKDWQNFSSCCHSGTPEKAGGTATFPRDPKVTNCLFLHSACCRAAEACWGIAAASTFRHLHTGWESELPLFKCFHSLRRPEYL